MIKLTLANGHATPVYAPVEQIELIETDPQSGITAVIVGGQWRPVTESPEEVARKVLEYRMEMERYKASVLVSLQDDLIGSVDPVVEESMKSLAKLSGLSAEKGADQ